MFWLARVAAPSARVFTPDPLFPVQSPDPSAEVRLRWWGDAAASRLFGRLPKEAWAALLVGLSGGIGSMALVGPMAAAILVVTLAGVALVIASGGCRALAQQDATSRLLLAATEQADVLISIVLPDGRMTHANGAFCRALGYERGEALERSADAFLAPQSSSQIAAIEETVRAEGVWRGTLVRQRQDGSTFLSSSTVTALAGPDGISHFVVVERDVTRETELREQLTHSERLAAAGQLVSGVAHELNNPLQAIIGFTELLIESERRHGSKADLDQVRTEAHRAAKIVRNLLAFVRRSAAERALVPLNALVQATVDLRRYELPTLNIGLEEQYAESLPPVVVNKEEIQQVLLNLLLNAEQAMQQANGGGRLIVRTAATPEGLIVEVQDDGPGVPAASAARIFEPFFTTKDVGKGTGLGLSIALGIAQAHGGTLALAPSTSGACFRLTLPAGAKTFVPHRGEQTEASSWSAVSGRRALVADDEVPLRKLLQRLLTRRGFAVDVAEDGVQAAALIDQNRYDIVLCDVQMPRMSGTDLYRSVQRRQPGTAANFVMVSGDILNDELDAFFRRSQIPLLAKPFGAKSLDAALEEAMTKRVQPPPTSAGQRADSTTSARSES